MSPKFPDHESSISIDINEGQAFQEDQDNVKSDKGDGGQRSNQGEEEEEDDDEGNEHKEDEEHKDMRAQKIKFTGITVLNANSRVPDGDDNPVPWIPDASVRETVYQIRQFLRTRPIAIVRVIRESIGSGREGDLEKALPYCGYIFTNGPWRNALIRFGIDPRTSFEYRLYQTITLKMECDPIIECGKEDCAEKDDIAFPQLLKGRDSDSHLINGKKSIPDDNTWQICDITDPLLQSIVATGQLRSEVSWKDGFFWNGTMAKLEVIMRDKLICLRDGNIPLDDEYRCLLGFPERYESSQRDHIRYGLEFGQTYTMKQAFLRGKILRRARISLSRGSMMQTQNGSQNNTPALEKPLTEDQLQTIDKIGNKQSAQRLYKRTLKIFSKEERLNAIDFLRTRKHVNPTTGQERPISISSASEVLYIGEGTLKRWIKEEGKIVEMRQGSSRADGPRKEPVKITDQYDSGHYPFLMLSPEELHSYEVIQRNELHKLHPFEHPVPFIGIEGGRSGRLKTFEDAYKYLGQQTQTFHIGHPLEPSEPSTNNKMEKPVQLPDPNSTSSYLRDPKSQGIIKKMTAQEVNSWLYSLSPKYEPRTLCSTERNPFYHELTTCVAFICQQMMAANDKLKSALPVRVEFDYD
ncbi:hypothetical protein DTO212C5_7005 [Paecilomyces variotii]|nr:hypothetical protein DTO212C5_7005 [Paecilomyces variotii]